MRLYYLLNKPTEALKLVTNPETTLIFREVTSLLILATLLFKNEMYEEVIQLFHIMIEKQFQGKKFPHNLVIMYFASCYKLVKMLKFTYLLNCVKISKFIALNYFFFVIRILLKVLIKL